jgi:hypothetical protein
MPPQGESDTLCFRPNGELRTSVNLKREGFGASGLYVTNDDTLDIVGFPGDGWPTDSYHEKCQFQARKGTSLTISGCKFQGTWMWDAAANLRDQPHDELFGCWSKHGHDASTGNTLCFGREGALESEEYQTVRGARQAVGTNGLYSRGADGQVTLIAFPGRGWIPNGALETCHVAASRKQLAIEGCALAGTWEFDDDLSKGFEARQVAK